MVQEYEKNLLHIARRNAIARFDSPADAVPEPHSHRGDEDEREMFCFVHGRVQAPRRRLLQDGLPRQGPPGPNRARPGLERRDADGVGPIDQKGVEGVVLRSRVTYIQSGI